MPELITAREDYGRRLAAAQEQLLEQQKRNAMLVWLRVVLFAIAATALFVGFTTDQYRAVWQTIGWSFAAGFMVAIVWHEHLRLKTLKLESDSRLFVRLLARLDRNWTQLPEHALLPELQVLPFTDDLDVAGPASLLALIDLAGTHPGRRILQQWLTQVPNWESVVQRQESVRALASLRELRLQLIQSVAAASDGSADGYGLPVWAAEPNWLPLHRTAHLISYTGPALVISGLLLVPVSVVMQATMLTNLGTGLLAAGFLINILVTVFWGGWLHDIFHRVTGQHRAAYQFSDMFAAMRDLPDSELLLREIRDASSAGSKSATRGFARLTWIIRLANLQRDPLLYFLYLALQLVFLWDFRIIKLLERWKLEYGSSVAGWFHALGTCEALVSCATLADEYPDWTYPCDTDQPQTLLDAQHLGHPLLPDTARVSNDICLQTDRPLLLVTGSNMAGKSTFMRAVGLNLLLARTGAPVCAGSLKTPLYELATSIRVRDSLREGVSFFMAELKRLKEVVDLAEHHSAPRSPRILFLLDEILQGTNSRERQIAVSSVLQRLIKCGAVGLVSTHDLDLAHVDEIKRVSQVVHFREYFESQAGREVMRFDYVMRPGSTPTTNALKLLKMVGLQSEE